MAKDGVVFMKADLSKPDWVIQETLEAYSQNSIPFYLVIPGQDGTKAIKPPSSPLFAGHVLKALKEARDLQKDL